MNIQDLHKAIYNCILLIIKYLTDLFNKQKEEIKVELQDQIVDEINYDKSFDPPSHNDRQIEIEEIAEEVIERISEKYILLKKEN